VALWAGLGAVSTFRSFAADRPNEGGDKTKKCNFRVEGDIDHLNAK